MLSSSFSVEFDFAADQGQFRIRLAADVEKHQSKLYYVVKNFRFRRQTSGSILPDIRIRKVENRWVHTDSEKSSDLSEAVGRVIDAHENGPADPGERQMA